MAKNLKFNTGNASCAYLTISESAGLELHYEAHVSGEDDVSVDLWLVDGLDDVGVPVSGGGFLKEGEAISDMATRLIPKLLSSTRINQEVDERLNKIKHLEQQIHALENIDVQPFVNP